MKKFVDYKKQLSAKIPAKLTTIDDRMIIHGFNMEFDVEEVTKKYSATF